MIVPRYITGLFLARALGTLLALTAILQLLDLLDQAGQLVTHGGMAAVAHYVALRVPSLLAGAVPLAALAGALLCFIRLAGGSEMTALRATGTSLTRLMLALVPACALVGVLQFALQAEIAPRTARALSNWWDRTMPPASPDPAPNGGVRIWLRLGQEVIAVGGVSADGRTLDRVLIVRRAADGDLRARIDAGSASFAAGHWILHDVSVARPDGGAARRDTVLSWPDGPSPANMIDVARPVTALTVERLVGILRGRWASANGPLAARTTLYGLAVSLLEPLLMVLLAAPLLLSPPRAGIAGLRILGVIGLGLGYLGMAGLLAAMAASGTLPPLLAVSLPLLVFGGVAVVTLLQSDTA